MGQQAAGLMANAQANDLAMKWADRENAAYHKLLHGERSQVAESESEGDEVIPGMNLGDVLVQQAPQRSAGGFLPLLLALLVGTAVPGAGVAGYLVANAMSRPAEKVAPAEKVEIPGVGLGHISDYVKEKPQ